MENKHISEMFDRIRSQISKNSLNIEIIQKIIKKQTKITLKPNTLRYKKNLLYITLKPIERNEIQLHKSKLQTTIQNETGLLIEDIRFK